MAIIAIVAARYVRRVFAGRDRAVMARAAGAHYLGMINPVGRRPERDVVAVLANIAGRQVIQRLAGGIRTVVTTAAIARNRCMIEISR